MTEQNSPWSLSTDGLVHWMKLYLADLLGESYSDIEENSPIRLFDLDSIDSVTMTLELEGAFEIRITPEYFFNGKLCLLDIAQDISAKNN